MVKEVSVKRPGSVYDFVFEDNDGELNKFKLRLKYSKSLGSKFTEEEDEYNYVRSINSSLNIQSKIEYLDKKDIHINFIDKPEEYFKSKGVWNNWYDFMGVDTKKFIQSKEEWINFCKKKVLGPYAGIICCAMNMIFYRKTLGTFIKNLRTFQVN